MIWIWLTIQLGWLAGGLGIVWARETEQERKLSGYILVASLWTLAQVVGISYDVAHDNWGWVQ